MRVPRCELSAVLWHPDQPPRTRARCQPTISPSAFSLVDDPKELDQQRRRDSTVSASSHDENVFELFQGRLAPRGLYLLDEHEAPLSLIRQLALFALLQETIGASQSRFVIVKHWPILMAFPGATVYSLDGRTLRRVARDDLEHVALTRDFLNDPDIYLLRVEE